MTKKQINVELNYEVRNGKILCYDVLTVSFLMGVKNISGQYTFYGIERAGSLYIIPVEKVKERLAVLQSRQLETQRIVNVMESVLKEVGKK